MTEENMIAVKATIVAAGAALTTLWGWFGWLVLVWVVLMATDWIVGSAIAAKNGAWSSATAREGAWHKAGQIIIVGVAIIVDWLVGAILVNIPSLSLPFDYSVLLSALVIIWCNNRESDYYT